jgi:hypothetical protein
MRILLLAVLLINSLANTPASKIAGPTLTSTSQDPPAPAATPTPDAARSKSLVQPFGGTTVTVPAGVIQADKAGWVESQMLAQEAARQVTVSLTHDLCVDPKNTGGGKLKINQLVIHNPEDFTAVELYSAVVGQLEHFNSELRTKNCEAEDMRLRTDPNVAVAPPAACMNAAVAASAGPRNCTKYLPGQIPTSCESQRARTEPQRSRRTSSSTPRFGIRRALRSYISSSKTMVPSLKAERCAVTSIINRQRTSAEWPAEK